MRRHAVALSLSFLLPVVSEAVAQGGDPCFEGVFESPFPHENLTLIPQGSYRSWVLAWSYNFEPNLSPVVPSLHMARSPIIQPELPNGISRKNAPNTPSENRAPKGYYMMFLVTNAGVPSVAHWVQLQ